VPERREDTRLERELEHYRELLLGEPDGSLTPEMPRDRAADRTGDSRDLEE
jgi:hypothetical protein